MEPDMKDIGKMISNMAWGKRSGLTTLDMKESTMKGRSMEKEHMCGLMEVSTWESGMKIE